MDGLPIPIADFERAQKNSPRFARTSTTSIMAIAFPPISWIVPGYVAEGLDILAGRQP
ncbi:hypothetical protein [Mesorhizobium sp.]|uniref:hypothetical protein n=1 Tax=Mesorhizobium sp. TaxID=1871066 RepID=UPI00257ABB00|nr:hypothetical protein [Mesorhizobium sp.]